MWNALNCQFQYTFLKSVTANFCPVNCELGLVSNPLYHGLILEKTKSRPRIEKLHRLEFLLLSLSLSYSLSFAEFGFGLGWLH